MNEHLAGWDFRTSFTGEEAALAMLGCAPTKDPAIIAGVYPALDQLRAAYEGTLRWFADTGLGPRTVPPGLLRSEKLLEQLSRMDAELDKFNAGDIPFLLWLRSPDSDFDNQHFAPSDIARWLQEINRESRYSFTSHPNCTMASASGRDVRPTTPAVTALSKETSSASVANNGVTTNRLRNRKQELDSEIALAKEKATDPSDYHSVWNALRELALTETAPFTGIVDDDKGLQYTNAREVKAYFSKDALRKRMNPSAR